MGEFKAQILSIILVLGIFAALQKPVEDTFTGAWDLIDGHVTDFLTITSNES